MERAFSKQEMAGFFLFVCCFVVVIVVDVVVLMTTERQKVVGEDFERFYCM